MVWVLTSKSGEKNISNHNLCRHYHHTHKLTKLKRELKCEKYIHGTNYWSSSWVGIPISLCDCPDNCGTAVDKFCLSFIL